jgi:hypothetical protein
MEHCRLACSERQLDRTWTSLRQLPGTSEWLSINPRDRQVGHGEPAELPRDGEIPLEERPAETNSATAGCRNPSADVVGGQGAATCPNSFGKLVESRADRATAI